MLLPHGKASRRIEVFFSIRDQAKPKCQRQVYNPRCNLKFFAQSRMYIRYLFLHCLLSRCAARVFLFILEVNATLWGTRHRAALPERPEPCSPSREPLVAALVFGDAVGGASPWVLNRCLLLSRLIWCPWLEFTVLACTARAPSACSACCLARPETARRWTFLVALPSNLLRKIPPALTSSVGRTQKRKEGARRERVASYEGASEPASRRIRVVREALLSTLSA